MLGDRREAAWARLEASVGDIFDRLAAIASHVDRHHFPLAQRGARFSHAEPPFDFQPILDQAPRARIVEPVDVEGARDSDARRSALHDLHWLFESFAVAVHLFRRERYRRDDRNRWLENGLAVRSEPTRVERYLAWIEELAEAYRRQLDLVAPIVAEETERRLTERLVEFLRLPFWQNRWFLYELWTMVLVLRSAGDVAPVELLGLRAAADGSIEWPLPGGKAKEPVAAIGSAPPRVMLWPQRQTYHPETGAQLEPDLRLVAESPPHHDLVVIENKDRRRPPSAEMAEIAERYVTGTCATTTWLLNYDRFTDRVEGLASRFPDRRLEVCSEFRPGNVPDSFSTSLGESLRAFLGIAERSVAAVALPPELRVVLTWGTEPRDLDLHAWVTRGGEVGHVFYSQCGSLAWPPFARLDTDAKDGHGREEICISTHDLDRLVVAVHQWSTDGSLPESGASVLLEGFDGAIRFSVPGQGTGRWWHCFALDRKGTALEVRGRLAEDPPT